MIESSDLPLTRMPLNNGGGLHGCTGLWHSRAGAGPSDCAASTFKELLPTYQSLKGSS